MKKEKLTEEELQEKYRERLERMIHGDDTGFPESIITYKQFKWEQKNFN